MVDFPCIKFKSIQTSLHSNKTIIISLQTLILRGGNNTYRNLLATKFNFLFSLFRSIGLHKDTQHSWRVFFRRNITPCNSRFLATLLCVTLFHFTTTGLCLQIVDVYRRRKLKKHKQIKRTNMTLTRNQRELITGFCGLVIFSSIIHVCEKRSIV